MLVWVFFPVMDSFPFPRNTSEIIGIFSKLDLGVKKTLDRDDFQGIQALRNSVPRRGFNFRTVFSLPCLTPTMGSVALCGLLGWVLFGL